MLLFDLIVWISTLEITFYVVAVLIYTIITLAICCRAAYENSDDFIRKKVLHPDFTIKGQVDFYSDHFEARAKCLHILQEWRNDIHKQMVILSSRLEKKHSLVRQHCKTIIDIFKEELHSTEAQMKLIAQDATVESLVDSQFVRAQLSMVRFFVEDLEKCLARVPKSLDIHEL